MNTIERLRFTASIALNNDKQGIAVVCQDAAKTLDRLLMAAASVIMVHDDGRLAGKGGSRAIETMRELVKEEQT